MKRIYFLLFAIAFFILPSCQKDNGDGPLSSIPKEFIGKWRQVHEKHVVIIDGQPTNGYENNTASSSYLEFKADGTATSNENGQVTQTFKYSVKNNMLTITDNDGKRLDADSKITVTATTLNLHQDVSGKQDGKTFTGTIDIDFMRVN